MYEYIHYTFIRTVVTYVNEAQLPPLLVLLHEWNWHVEFRLELLSRAQAVQRPHKHSQRPTRLSIHWHAQWLTLTSV